MHYSSADYKPVASKNRRVIELEPPCDVAIERCDDFVKIKTASG